MSNFIDIMPDPAIVGESLYRALHEELQSWFESMPEDEQAEVARGFAADLRDNARLIDNKISEYEKANNKESN